MQKTWQSNAAAWPDAYWNALEFYFWEPQHLNRFSPPSADKKRGVDEVLKRLRAKEVPLNHLFTIFFSLAPAALSARLVTAIASGVKGASAHLISSPEFRHSKLCGICQPDLLLIVDGRTVFLELKLESRTSSEQLLKYALMGKVLSREGDQAPALVLVGRTEKFREAAVFADQLAKGSLQIPPTVEKHARSVHITDEQLLAAARQMPVYLATYSKIRDRLNSELESISPEVESGQTLNRLLQGMIDALGEVAA